MLKGIHADDLKVIAGRGGGFHIDAREYSPDDLKVMAGRLSSGGQIILSHSDCLSIDDMKVIAGRSGEGATVIFQ